MNSLSNRCRVIQSRHRIPEIITVNYPSHADLYCEHLEREVHVLFSVLATNGYQWLPMATVN